MSDMKALVSTSDAASPQVTKGPVAVLLEGLIESRQTCEHAADAGPPPVPRPRAVFSGARHDSVESVERDAG
jgi:hypothetical protein